MIDDALLRVTVPDRIALCDLMKMEGVSRAYILAGQADGSMTVSEGLATMIRFRAAAQAPLLAELEKAEAFMSGFEGDPEQEGIDERLASIRAVIAKAKGGAA